MIRYLVPLPFDRGLHDVARVIQVAGILAFALPGGHLSACASLKSLVHDEITDLLAKQLRAVIWPEPAGFASRFAAFAVDVAVSVGVFLLALAAISFTARVLTGRDIAWNRGDIWVVIACGAWEFVYFAYCWAASGRTVGMALSGVRVVGDDGSGRRWAAGGRPHAGSPAELPAAGAGVRGHLAGWPAPRTA